MNKEEEESAALSCLQTIWQLQVNDSIYTNFSSLLHSKNESRGLKTFLDIDYLPRGLHRLIVQKRMGEFDKETQRFDTLYWEKENIIPFIKE